MAEQTAVDSPYFKVIYKILKIVHIGERFLAQGNRKQQIKFDRGRLHQKSPMRPPSKKNSALSYSSIKTSPFQRQHSRTPSSCKRFHYSLPVYFITNNSYVFFLSSGSA